MKIKYESTIDDAISCTLKSRSLILPLKKKRLKSTLIWAIVFFIFIFAILPFSAIERLSLAIPFTVIFGLLYFFIFLGDIKKNVRNSILNDYETDDPMTIEYEMTEEGFSHKAADVTTTSSWSIIRAIRDEGEIIEIQVRSKGLIVLPKRIFKDDTELQEWMNYAKSKIGQQINRATSE